MHTLSQQRTIKPLSGQFGTNSGRSPFPTLVNIAALDVKSENLNEAKRIIKYY